MRIINARVYRQDFHFALGELCVENGVFVTAEQAQAHTAAADAEEIIDAGGLYALPGLVDIHLHGAAGVDFMDGSVQSLQTLAAFEASCGVTSICPASMTMAGEDIKRACAAARDFKAAEAEASLTGIYMEGPFVAPAKVGAQNPAFVQRPSRDFFEEMNEAAGGLIKFLALAPELPGALPLIKDLHTKVQICLAHTAADYETCVQALGAGAGQLTHLYNAMPGLHHRAPGPIAAGSDNVHCRAEIICDGIHIHPAAVRAAFRLFGAERLIFISDSMMACGLKDGMYQLGGQDVQVTSRRAELSDGTIAGSASTLFDCLQTAVRQMQIPLEDAVRCATFNPAQALGLEKRIGSTAPGCEASLLLVDGQLQLQAVLLRGRWISVRRA